MFTVQLQCVRCGKGFVFNPSEFNVAGLQNIPQKCPSCSDMAQARPELVIERKCEKFFPVVRIKSLPTEWTEFKPEGNDFGCYKIDMKGSRFGAQWSGRIIIYGLKPFAPDDIVSLSVMSVKKQVREMTTSRATMKHGTVSITRRVPLSCDDGDVKEVQDIYLRLDPAQENGEETPSLVWATAYSKTTLKGLGRQFHASLDDSAALWSMSVHGGARKGRFGTTGILAIVSKKYPLVKKFTEGGQTTETLIF